MLSLHADRTTTQTLQAWNRSQRALQHTQHQLGAGQRVLRATDDAAGLQIATRLEALARGQRVAMRNAQNGMSLLQTAEGALGEVHSVLLRMRDLAIEAATDSTSTDDRAALQAEYDALGGELRHLVMHTTYGGTGLFSDGVQLSAGGLLSGGVLRLQTGATPAETLVVDVGADMARLRGGLTAVSEDKYANPIAGPGSELTAGAQATGYFVWALDGAIQRIGGFRATLGAAAQRLQHVQANLDQLQQQAVKAWGRIVDLDFAEATVRQTAEQLRVQAGAAVLRQSRQAQALVVTLLG